MLNLVRPRFFMPVHGEFRHLALHSEIAEDVGISKDRVIVTDDGNTVELGDGIPHFGNKVPAGYVFVDGLGGGDVGSVVLRDRRGGLPGRALLPVPTPAQSNPAGGARPPPDS